MWDRVLFIIRRFDERLWVRPLLLGVVSVAAAFVARAADQIDLRLRLPNITPDSIETLLSITASSMLVIATLAVTSMVSAYGSASRTATPRSFSLLVADDLSQNALSTFLGAFIFTFVGLIALKNDLYGVNGLFVLFGMTVIVVAIVLVTFVRWVDWIARLGRIGTTVEKVEAAGISAFERNRRNRRLGGVDATSDTDRRHPVYDERIGYVQHVNVEALQNCAERLGLHMTLAAVPGTFVAPGRPLAYLHDDGGDLDDVDTAPIVAAFDLGDHRVYDDDPRFALVALSEIGSRALSPAVNDPGTAIAIFGAFIRLFSVYTRPIRDGAQPEVRYDRIRVPTLSPQDMLDDAFRAIARDGAGIVEVQIRLQKTLCAIAELPDDAVAAAARQLSRTALQRAENAIDHETDVALVASSASWSK